MTEKLNSILPSKIEASPQHQPLKLPKLKKIGEKQKLPKLELPKLKKLEV